MNEAGKSAVIPACARMASPGSASGQESPGLLMGWGDAQHRRVPGTRLAVPAEVVAETRDLDDPVQVGRGLGDLGRQQA